MNQRTFEKLGRYFATRQIEIEAEDIQPLFDILLKNMFYEIDKTAFSIELDHEMLLLIVDHLSYKQKVKMLNRHIKNNAILKRDIRLILHTLNSKQLGKYLKKIEESGQDIAFSDYLEFPQLPAEYITKALDSLIEQFEENTFQYSFYQRSPLINSKLLNTLMEKMYAMEELNARHIIQFKKLIYTYKEKHYDDEKEEVIKQLESHPKYISPLSFILGELKKF